MVFGKSELRKCQGRMRSNRPVIKSLVVGIFLSVTLGPTRVVAVEKFAGLADSFMLDNCYFVRGIIRQVGRLPVVFRRGLCLSGAGVYCRLGTALDTVKAHHLIQMN
jgi:hypothetical protein